MDKLMDNPWFIKMIALLLALLLYTAVPSSGTKSTGINVPGETSSTTIKDIPVMVYYDTDNLVVSGIPDTVEISLKGPMPQVQSAKALKNFEVYVDLKNAKIGTQKVKFEVRNLSDKLKATIKPDTANVLIQEKITKEFTVEAEYDSTMIEEGYAAGQPVVEPNKVKITGAKNIIDRITYIKATVDSKEKIKETISKTARIRVLDKELNKLNVLVVPESVKVTIPIKSITKTVPIQVIKKGSAPAGITIDSVELDSKEATITGNEGLLKEIENVWVEVDVSKITDNTTLSLPVMIPNGISKVSPQMVKATVVVKKPEEKTVSGIPLKIRGLSEQYEADIHDPATRVINLVVNGPSAKVSGLRPEDFTIFIDLSGLTEGNHDVTIHVEGPADVTWRSDKSSARITIKRDNV